MEKIARDLPFLRGIKGLIMLNASPLTLTDGPADAYRLVSSTEGSWEMSENINLYNPLYISPPSSLEQRGSRTLAYLLEGEFQSYFRGREIPPRPVPQEEEEEGGEDLGLGKTELSVPESFRSETTAGKIIAIGSSAILEDAVMDRQSSSPNSAFVLNLLDYLSGREDYAVMRSKGQSYNPLKETKGSMKSFVKGFNIAGLPILVVLVGLLVWASWLARKKRIQSGFQYGARSGKP